LKLTGTWNGDLYCYLTHSSGYTVLLNRVGRRSTSSLGYGDEGFNVTFDDASTNGDIHIYRRTLSTNESMSISGALTNVWAPDGRTANPATVLDTSSRTALLSSFNGLNPNGEWVLFVADMESGDIFTLDNWGLEITGYTPPSIVSSPLSLTNECSTGSAVFSVTATGSETLVYQWRVNGAPVSGATNSTLTLNSPTFADAGQYDVVVTNNYGTNISLAATLTIQDTTPPSIACPAIVIVNTDVGHCYASGVSLGTPVASDTCGGVTLSNNAPAQFSLGTNTVTWTATDEHNNVKTCTQTVVVNDNQPPTITAPAALTDVATDSGKCYATSVPLGTPVANDNCGVLTVTNDAPAQFQKGNTTVTWTAVDNSGNIASATQVVTVRDHELPTFTAPAALADVPTDAGQCYATTVTLGAPQSHDNCAILTVTNNAPAQFAKGDTIVTWTAVDTSGNIATATQIVTVQDHELPTITAPAALADVHTEAGQCYATNVTLGTPITADNCGVATVTNNAPAQFAKGNTTVIWTVVDTSGNIATATQLVTVQDHEIPTLTAPVALTDVHTDAGQCYATSVNLGVPSATNDNCGLATVTNNAPAQFPKGDTTVTWTAVDTSGNTTTATQVVTVKDHELPTITAPAVVSVNADAGKCYATGVGLGVPLATNDNCGVASVTNDAPSQFPVGNTTVTWTVIDTSGNLASAPQTVTVNDNQNPVVHCPTDITVYTTNAAGIAVTFSPTADDNCGVQSLVANPASGSNFPIGDTAVTVTATDIHGNTNQCSFTVTVILDHAPVAGSINLGAVANHPRTLLIDKVLGEATDLDANTLTLTAVSANSTNGGTVTLTETNIIYTPVSNFAGADSFTYTISDGHSGTASGSVLILVLSESEASLNQVGQPIATTNGTVVVRFAGIPGLTYSVQRSSDQVNWNSAGSYVVPDTGIAEYTDSTPAPQPPYYYRTVIQ